MSEEISPSEMFAAFWESLRRNPAMAAKFQRGAA